MDGTEVLVRKEGDRLILTPVRQNRLTALLDSWEPLDESMPEVADEPPQTRDEL
jgi:antitoxin VapB